MSKNVLILNGATRKNGSTSKLVMAFAEGVASAGHHIDNFFLFDMNIRDCIGCNGCAKKDRTPDNPCVQKDDMADIYAAFAKADVVVFASPIYFWTITGVLKTATDRLHGSLRCLGYDKFPRQGVLLMTAGSPNYEQAVTWYRTFERNLGWHSLGEVLGSGKEDEARKLGVSI